jgi:hypothetical protein
MDPGYREEYRGKKDVIMTHPLTRETPCVLSTEVDIPKNKKTLLKTLVSHHDKGDWELIIRVNGSIQKTITIGKETVNNDGWLEVVFDLENKANGWAWEAGYWKEIRIE